MTIKRNIAIAAASASLLVAANVLAKDAADKKLDLSTQKAKLGYTFGTQIGGNLIGQGVDKKIDIEALIAAIRDAATGAEPQLSAEDMQQAQLAFQQELQAEQEKQQAELAKKGEENKAAAAKFMAANAKKKGVKTTESGLQYKELRKGKGKSPTDENVIKVHYVGKLIDGTKFDSSHDRGQPANFAVSAVIPGFSEGLKLMKEGAKFEFVIPENLAYGLQAPPSIGPNQALIFEVELIEVSPLPGKKEG